MLTVSELITLGGAIISAIGTLSIALAKIKILEKKVEVLENMQVGDHTILIRLESKMDMLLNGQIRLFNQQGQKSKK